jgi:hypothetical protein
LKKNQKKEGRFKKLKIGIHPPKKMQTKKEEIIRILEYSAKKKKTKLTAECSTL